MPDRDDKKQSWWATLPGLLTAAGGFITALTGLLIGLNQLGIFPVLTKPAPTPSPTLTLVRTRLPLITPSASPPSGQPNLDVNGESTRDIVNKFYQDQNDNRLADAYSLFSSRYRSQEEPFSKFANGRQGTQGIVVSIEDAYGNWVRMYVTWTRNGTTQLLEGYWYLKMENGVWKLDDWNFHVK